MALDLKAALTKKLGPLPVWAWGGIGAAGGWFFLRNRDGGEEELEEVSDFEYLPAKAVSGVGAFDDDFEDSADIFAEDNGGPVTGGGPPERPPTHGPDIKKAIARQKKLIERLKAMRKKATGAQRRRLIKRTQQAQAVVAVLKGKPVPKKKKKKAKKK